MDDLQSYINMERPEPEVKAIEQLQLYRKQTEDAVPMLRLAIANLQSRWLTWLTMLLTRVQQSIPDGWRVFTLGVNRDEKKKIMESVVENAEVECLLSRHGALDDGVKVIGQGFMDTTAISGQTAVLDKKLQEQIDDALDEAKISPGDLHGHHEEDTALSQCQISIGHR